ncbi:MAG: cell division protein FtsA [Candidatus Marinimicrobia bacterium]|jgi:cell division protein FtsA|nr:cell division protein FtsA [Candidatus Neomarinimicrobiota bacterium]MCK9483732.1 cell division protein FtsA [Candidatus Neomarinimicrobiota bacterium]MCK9560323.1 cell division protein FtsA [Candidatus Neomarinimicrobiota bacterium]MDD5062886.1 cell division protein FtsA [Candidatus Neomarinimicrobiota bacterium]
MKMIKLKNQIVTGLDIGSSKICVVIAEVDSDSSEPIIKGYGIVPSKGIKKGLVVDIDNATKAIFNAVNEAEKMAGVSIESCYVGVSGDHIRSMNTRGMMALSRDSRAGLGEARPIEKEDIERVIEHTKAVPFPIDRQILHILPQEFIIDDQAGVKNPLNLSGRRLDAKVHLTSYNTTVLSNLSKCIQNADLEIDGFVLSSLAAAYACLEESEKTMGSVLLDIGSGTIDVIVFYDEGVHHTGVVNMGAGSVTNDIAYMLRVPLEQAESIKREHGFAKVSLTDKEAFFKLDGLGGRTLREISLYDLAEWIEPRVEEILRESFLEAKKADISLTNTLSVVLTGGGALLKGTDELAETIFNTPAKIVAPRGFQEYVTELSNPAFSVAIGLIKYAIAEQINGSARKKSSGGALRKIRGWIKHLTENVM